MKMSLRAARVNSGLTQKEAAQRQLAMAQEVAQKQLDDMKKTIQETAEILKTTPKAASEYLIKLLGSAIANAENNFHMDYCCICSG